MSALTPPPHLSQYYTIRSEYSQIHNLLLSCTVKSRSLQPVNLTLLCLPILYSLRIHERLLSSTLKSNIRWKLTPLVVMTIIAVLSNTPVGFPIQILCTNRRDEPHISWDLPVCSDFLHVEDLVFRSMEGTSSITRNGILLALAVHNKILKKYNQEVTNLCQQNNLNRLFANFNEFQFQIFSISMICSLRFCKLNHNPFEKVSHSLLSILQNTGLFLKIKMCSSSVDLKSFKNLWYLDLKVQRNPYPIIFIFTFMETSKKRICILGSANNDFFVYVKNIPAPGETIQSNKQLQANGGKGANQAVAAARLSGSSLFLGQVGNDPEKALLEKQMSQSKVDLKWTVKPGVPTGKAIIMIDTTGQNSIIIIGGANTAYDNLDTLPQDYKKGIQQSDILMLQKQIPMQINVLAAEYAHSLGKVVMLDCGGSDEEIPERLLKSLSFLSPNQTELLRIDPNIDQQNITEEVRKKIIGKFPGMTVLLKLGSKGARLITETEDVAVTVSNKVNTEVSKDYKIIDTVGAGDCFTSAFVTKYSEFDKKTLTAEQYKQCITFANASAFLCITKNGAMPSLPYRKDVNEFIEKYSLNSK